MRGLRASEKAFKSTHGIFDITVGAVLWKKATAPVGQRHLVLSGDRFRFERDPLRLTFGGIAKGMAVGELATKLYESGLRDFKIDAGGGNLALAGAFASASQLGNAEPTAVTFVSSSSATNHGEQHLLDPSRSDRKVSGHASLACRGSAGDSANWAELSGLADAYSTALVIEPSLELPSACAPLPKR
jgi:hypothetical protein